MNVKELVFKSRAEMSEKMEFLASKYEGYIPGRTGYNFPNADGSYTIAYVKSDITAKKHEMCHAMYYFDLDYREKVKKLWDTFSSEEQELVKKFLARCGYKEEFYLDEFQAYYFSEENPRKFFGLKKTR